MASSVLIVGGGKVGSHLAGMLLRRHEQIRLVEMDPTKVADLQERLPGVTVVHGSGTEASVLEAAGIHSAGVLAAVTGSDEANLVVCALARFSYGVARTIARVNDPRNAWMFADDLGVDAALDQAEIVGALVSEEMSMGAMTTLLKLGRGRFSLVEERVMPGAPIVGHSITLLAISGRAVPVGVIRDGPLLVAHADLQVAVGDEVLAVVHEEALDRVAAELGAGG